MYNFLLHFHSGFRWIVLLTMIISLIYALIMWNKAHHRNIKPYLFALIAAHIQLLLGLILYFISPTVVFTEETMSNSFYRFYTVEHGLTMLAAIILITLAYLKAKKTEGNPHKSYFIWAGIGFVLMLIRIPWPWQELGAGWV